MAMKRLLVIGIGCGDPDLLTVQAARLIGTVDVFVIVDKGDVSTDLMVVRRAILDRHASDRHRTVTLADPRRDAALPYAEAVRHWHEERVVALERVFADEVDGHETAAMLVWGDPSLYDSTLRIVDQIRARGTLTFDVEVVAGISSVQLLAARHRIALHRIGGALHITTGRNLSAGGADGLDDIVVMLDGAEAFTTLVGQRFDIFWGAYLGGPNEVLIAGRLEDVADTIVRTRREQRQEHGWMFDIYYLRRRPS